MSMLAGALPQLASLVAQPAVLAAGLATGVAVGAVGVGTGAIPVTDPAPRNAVLYECPGSERIVTSIAPNQSVLVTARTADGQWLQIYIGEAGAERGWAPASALQLKAAPDSLPVADCTPDATAEPFPTLGPPSEIPKTEAPSELPSGAPSASPSGTPRPSATPAPTQTPTPTPTPTPLTGPVLSDAMVYAPVAEGDGVYRIYYRDYYWCPYAWNNVGVAVAAEDPDGVAGVTMYYQLTGSGVQSVPMSDEDGYGTLWDGALDAQEGWAEGPFEVWMQGVDGNGNLGPILDLGSLGYEFAVGNCIPDPTPTPSETP